MNYDAPVCPGCGARATWNPDDGVWETFHNRDCTWMNDPESEPYG